MDLKLYYSPGACSLASHIVLEELGFPYTAQKLNLLEGEQRKPEYLKLNPMGRVPTLVVEAPADPVHPPPAAATLAAALGRARLVAIPGLGHVAGDETAERLAELVLNHTMSIPTSA